MKPKERPHVVFNKGNFGRLCWCGGYHRIVHTLKTHGHRKRLRLTMLEDIESE